MNIGSVIIIATFISLVSSEGKRRKLKRKIVSPVTKEERNMEEKLPRGYLDDYYSKFTNRITSPSPSREESLIKILPQLSNKRNDDEKSIMTAFPASDNSEIQKLFKKSNSYDSSFYPAYATKNGHRDSTYLSDPLSKYFGVSGTTSQSIQLGLTFTVPFLSFPMSSLSSLLSGDSTSLLNFNKENFLIVGILTFLAIFLLPQAIYWLTGVNLSAFQWGRNDDSNELNLRSLTNAVDGALYRYDVDVRSCLSEIICQQLKNKDKSLLRRGIIGFLSRSDPFRDFMGQEKLDATLQNAYSDQNCSSSSSCPWDVGPLTKFATEIISRRGSEIVSQAMSSIVNDGLSDGQL